ncbi:MAG: hypothetical protein KBS57_03505 [Alistipes sp.]|nr:hypothetical protein [Candidatus Minthomonas equi]
MKRLLIITLSSILSLAALNAQPRSLGGRFGYGSQELSYQHYVRDQFIQFDFGTANFKNIQLHATYNWIIANPAWTTKGNWYLYGGAGIGGGYSNNKDQNPYGFIGIAGRLGLEYQFEFPLSLSIDFRPLIGPKLGDGGGLYDKWPYIFLPCLGVKYLF